MFLFARAESRHKNPRSGGRRKAPHRDRYAVGVISCWRAVSGEPHPLRIVALRYTAHGKGSTSGTAIADFRLWRNSAQNERAEHVCSARGNSDVDLFGYRKGIIKLDAEVPDGTFDLGVAKQQLHGS